MNERIFYTTVSSDAWYCSVFLSRKTKAYILILNLVYRIIINQIIIFPIL